MKKSAFAKPFACCITSIVWAMVFLLAGVVPSASAATKFWTGSVNGNFNNSGNWSPSGAPAAGDDLVFQPPPVTRLLVTNDFSPNRAFNSITFQGSNYFVRGNPIILTNGLSALNTIGTNHIDADVELRGSQSWEGTGTFGLLEVGGNINLNANTLTVKANTADFIFGGVISGAGNLVKTNVGTLRVNGLGHNTYSGFTRLDGGVFELDKAGFVSVIPLVFSNFTAIPGDLTIGDGNGIVGTDVLRLLANDQIADTSDVTVKNSGMFDLKDFSDRIGSLTMQGGTVDSGAGTLILGGNVTTLADANTATINGQLSLGGGSRTFTVNPGAATPDLRINANISGDSTSIFITPGITKTGGGTLFLVGTNTYNGTTTIQDGQLAALSDRALGATTAGTVVNGTGNLFLSNVQVTNEDLTINSSGGSQALGASGASVWTGDITLNADTQIASSGSLLLNGTITGVGGFTKTSTGSLTLSGTNVNTYTGTTTVRDGTLLLDKNTGAVNDDAMSGPLVIGEDELPVAADVVRYLRCCQLPDDTDITINASGLLDLNGFGDNVRNLIFNGGTVDTAAGGSILPLGITVNANTNAIAVISGRLSVLGSPIINTIGHNFSPDIRIDALVHGAGNLTKNGVGELSLTAANTYSGLTTVNDGFLEVDDSGALGTTNSGTIVKSGAVLALRFGVAVFGETLALEGKGQSGFGALSSSFGSNFWSGNITLSSNSTISVEAGDFLNLSNSVTGAWDITKTGAGTLILGGGTANSFDDLFANAGTVILEKSIANAAGPAEITIGDSLGTDILKLGAGNQIGDTVPIHINLGGRLDLNDMNETTGSIDGRGIIDLGSGILREGTDNGSSTFSGPIIGTGQLFKLGLGTWTLTGNNSYSGPTTVSAGTLIVNGDQHQSGVTVNGSANLVGSGTIGDLLVFGNLRPGSSPGILTSSNVQFDAASDFFVELNGSTPGTGYDQLNVRGTNQLGGSSLHVLVGAGFAPAEGERLTIINNDGSEAIQGTFAGLANGSLLTAGGLQFHIYYSAIFVNDVFLEVTNTALELGAAPTVETGNGNGDIEPGECNLLRIVLTNKLGGIVSGVSATLSSTNAGVTITQPFSTYPNMSAHGRRTNDTPFQISTSPALVCGTNIDLLLTVHTATNGSFSVPFSILTGTAGTALRFNQTTDLAIPDIGTVESTNNVSGFLGVLARATVSLYITHTAAGDLSLSLIAPDGTSIDLSSNNGGTGDDFGTGEADVDRTTFSDLAATSITAGSAPFRGSFRPEEPLSTFRGKLAGNVNGPWRLRINDSAGGSLGTLRTWSLSLSPIICLPGGGECDPPCPGCAQQLAITPDPSNASGVLLKWSTSAIGYDLLSSPTIVPASGFLSTGPAPVVVGGKFTVTNTMSGNRFYELRKP